MNPPGTTQSLPKAELFGRCSRCEYHDYQPFGSPLDKPWVVTKGDQPPPFSPKEEEGEGAKR